MADRPENIDARLESIADAVCATIGAHMAMDEDVHAVLILTDAYGGGLVAHDYDSEWDAVPDLLGHLQAIYQANGRTFGVLPLTRPKGEG